MRFALLFGPNPGKDVLLRRYVDLSRAAAAIAESNSKWLEYISKIVKYLRKKKKEEKTGNESELFHFIEI